ncbi:myo-inosose-2 dehydratase [Erwinia sp. JUb26]|uniref:myo-inosose-2 dehydratase n=1 Tax=Erwinia sp. JUb26 TaxID=2485126 RepID=UPI000F4A7BDA|nr:myo-inosose-2 dehydratase [Erwinia sp. JUb26]ROR07899.1 2-keto-myo-inositol dehydratase [Erwinia sp. JUb26]
MSNTNVQLGVSPLAWTNDVLEDLGDNVSALQCMQEAAAIGYRGIELGRKFPREPSALRPLLQETGLSLASGWFSGTLADISVEQELHNVADHARLLSGLGCKVMVYGECGGMPGETPLDIGISHSPALSAIDFDAYARRMSEFSSVLYQEYGLKLAYHHHLMMLVEHQDEIERFFSATADDVGMLLDTGHAVAAGSDLNALISRFGSRICHIHLKDIRRERMAQVYAQDQSFNEGVRGGMFTVPGDGYIDYQPVVDYVNGSGYRGWLIVEAEQDPLKAPSVPTVTRAFNHVNSLFSL